MYAVDNMADSTNVSAVVTVRLTRELVRRQSLLASAQDADRDILDFIEHAGDSRGWK